MRGNITRRGKTSWRLKFDIGVDDTGKRLIEYETVRGTKKDAQEVLARRLADVADGKVVRRSSETLADYARLWASAIAPARTSGTTLERYKEIIEKHIVPHLGVIALKDLNGPAIDCFYTHCRTAGRRDGTGGLSQQTVHHIHRLLSQILASAVKAKKLRQSPIIDVQTTPKARKAEVRVLDDEQLAILFRHLEGRPLYVPVLLAASTGMRRGEVLAVRWRDIDLDRSELQVAQVAELVARKVSIKEPKTDRSRRAITLPERLVEELRSWRKEHARLCLGLGLGKVELVFPHWPTGRLINPSHFTKAFSREIASANLPNVTFHGLRHTHITHLLRSGVPVHVVSARAGHANPTVTLNIYAHLLPGQQEQAANIMMPRCGRP